MGLLFLMTQYLQFSLGFTPFAAGIRILPVAIILGVAAPISTFIDKYLGTKITVAGAMLIIALGCYMLSLTTIHSTYNDVLFGLIVVGLGSGLAFPPATEAVMGTLKSENTGVGSATNSAAMQLGGALGVGIIGTALTSRYQGNLSKVLMGHNIPPVALNAIKGSLGGALAVAHIAGGTSGKLLAAAANSAFISGMDLGLQVGSVVAVVAAVLIIGFLPSRNIHLNVPDTKDKLRRSEDSSSQSLKSTDKNRAKCIL
jgi:dipeptide/tripeptide permease